VPTPCSPCYFFGGEVEVAHVRRVLADGVSTPIRANVGELLPVSIDWNKALNLINVFTIDSLRARGVEDHALVSLEHGDDRLSLHERHRAIGHRVNLRPYKSDSETLIAIAGALLRAQLSPEETAAVLGTATFAGCSHATKQKSDALKRRAIMRAVGSAGNESLRQQHRAAAIAAGEPAWRDLNKKSLSPLPTVFNIRLALVTMGIGVRLDLFRDRIIVTYSGSEHVLQESVGEVLTDRAENAICKFIDDRWGFDSTDQLLHRAILQAAIEHAFDPILDYLNEVELNWDGVERLKRAAVDYFEAEDTPLNSAIIEATLVGSVRRARVPGSKFDSIMTLESTEGFNKSGAIALLYGKQFFSDQTILGKSDREIQELLAGVWGFECADLSGISKAEVESVKSFASRVEDRARGAYARSVGWVKRRCVIWATTNDEVYLLSQTGNRRFWPLRVLRPLDLAKLARDRDQLWAEAAHRESETEGDVNIPESLWDDAAAAQEERRVSHPWEERLACIPESIETNNLGVKQRLVQIIHRTGPPHWELRVRAQVLLDLILHIPPSLQTPAHGKTLSSIMTRRLGWQRPTGGSLRIDGSAVRGYWRPDPCAPRGPLSDPKPNEVEQ
jgi:hypothetical protein